MQCFEVKLQMKLHIKSRITPGKTVKELWSVPIITAILFLLGAWISFGMGDGAFVLRGLFGCWAGFDVRTFMGLWAEGEERALPLLSNRKYSQKGGHKRVL